MVGTKYQRRKNSAWFWRVALALIPCLWHQLHQGWWMQGSGKPLPRTIAIFFSRKGDKRFIKSLYCFTCFELPDISCWKASSPLIIQGVDFHCWWGYIIWYLLPNLFLDHYVECAIAVPCFMRFFLIYGTQEGSCCSGNMNAQKEPFGLGKELLLIKMLLYRHIVSCFVQFQIASDAWC